MKLLHIKRGTLWIKEISLTLLIFWIKHPQETPAVMRFSAKKILVFPKFLRRNVLIEKQGKSYAENLKEVKKIYELTSKDFDPENLKTYKLLEKLLTDKLQILYFIVRKVKPKLMIETGVAAGESTGYILQAMKDNDIGTLYSIDLPFQWYVYGNHELHLDSLPAGETPGYLLPDELKKRWHLILGDTYEKLPNLLRTLKIIDIFFHDSEHSDKTMTFEYTKSWPVIREGGFLLSDDTNFTNAFLDFAKKNKKKHIIFMNMGIVKK